MLSVDYVLFLCCIHSFPIINFHSQIRVMSSDNTCDVHQVLEPVRIDSSILRAPLSPPPTIKKYTSFFFPSPLRDEKHQNISRKCTYGALRPCKYPRRTQVTTFYILATLLGLFCWWRSGHVQNLEYLKQRASDIKKNLLLPQALEGLHFIPASNRNFHVRSIMLYKR